MDNTSRRVVQRMLVSLGGDEEARGRGGEGEGGGGGRGEREEGMKRLVANGL